MNKFLINIALFLLLGTFSVCGQDAVVQTIKFELNRNFEVLKTQPIPAYYAFVRLDEMQSISTGANLGRLQSEATLDSPKRILTACLRVGDYTLDNSHEIREAGWGGIQVGGRYLPFEENDKLLKNAIWLSLDELYKDGIQTYEQVKANVAVKVEQEDKSPDFSQETAVARYEKPLTWAELNINPKALEAKVRKYSAIFDENNDLQDGSAHFTAGISRTVFIDTEGRESAKNSLSIHLILMANTVAEDGMQLPLHKSWMGFSLNELPSDEEVIQAAREMSTTLSALSKAPVVESFSGPAILSPEAAGVFFHEIFGHRIEGSRLKQEDDAQTFKKKAGEPVLPKHLSVTFDPTVKYFRETPLVGSFLFDDEGIPSQKVEVVKNGMLKNFLMSRTPIDGFLHSNGHGRGAIGNTPVSRQSNLFVESSQKFSDEELLNKLRKEAKSQGKKYAYYFKDVSGGFTTTDRYRPNSFNVTPLIVYRVYVDGRPDELVRGVDLVGTPLAMFSQIEAAGNRYAVFNGVCGAESGGVPVAAVAPALLVKRIETQKKAKSQSQPILLPKPNEHHCEQREAIQKDTMNDCTTLTMTDSVIFRAITEEVTRGLDSLKMDKLGAPFFIAYSITDMKGASVVASGGSLRSSEEHKARVPNVRLLMGDYQCTDENFQGTAGGSYSREMPTLDNDVQGLRYTIWKSLDGIYKSAAETYEQKKATIKQLNIPAKDLELPDWEKTEPVQMTNLPKKELDFTQSRYEEYAKAASAVFNDYPEILDSNFAIQLADATVYFYNTEGTYIKYPLAFVVVAAKVFGKNAEGESLSNDAQFIFGDTDELPSLTQMQDTCRQIALKLIEEINAPKIEDSYSGPVLFEGLAVPNIFYSSFFEGENSLIASRKPLTTSGFSYGGNGMEEMMGKRITAREITIEDLTGTPEYQGTKLIGYAPVDGQGVIPPAKLTLVENGILKTLLSDRIPTPKVQHSNGHALFGMGGSSGITTGVARLSDTRQKSPTELKKELLARAKEEGSEYAYIVRRVSGSEPTLLYRINVNDGSEKRIRSAEINQLNAQVFKKVIAVSNEERIESMGVTLITPSAILFDDIQIQSDRIDNFKKAPLVSQPK